MKTASRWRQRAPVRFGQKAIEDALPGFESTPGLWLWRALMATDWICSWADVCYQENIKSCVVGSAGYTGGKFEVDAENARQLEMVW
jgi:hypothetical protein